MESCILDSQLYRITSTKCRINTVVPPDDGPGEVRNMYRLYIKLTKYTKNKSCTKLVSFTRKKFSPLYLQPNFQNVSSKTRLNNKTANTPKVTALQTVR